MPEDRETRVDILFEMFLKKELSVEDMKKIEAKLESIYAEVGITDQKVKRNCLNTVLCVVLTDRLARYDTTLELEALQTYIDEKYGQDDYSLEATSVYYHIEPWLYREGYRVE